MAGSRPARQQHHGRVTEPRRRDGDTVTRARVPPHDLGAERALLASILLGRRDAIDTARAVIEPDDFYAPGHGHVFAAAVNLHVRGEGVDPVVVCNELARVGLLELVGGAGAVVALSAEGATGNPAGYARIISEMATRRRLIVAAVEIETIGWSSEGDLALGLAEARDQLADVLASAAGGRKPADPLEDETPSVVAAMRGELGEAKPAIFERSDGVSLIYPGMLHWIMSRPGLGKTMCALLAAAQELEAGSRVGMLDYEGNPRIVGGRLAMFGVTDGVVDRQFTYRRPKVLSKADTPRLVDEMRGCSLVIIDGVAKSIARQGWNEDAASEVLAWLELIVNPLCADGIAVLVLDHVTKDKETQGLWARGSGAKQGEVDGAAYKLVPREAFSRTRSGSVDLMLAKDREGWVGAEGDVVATLRVHVDDDGTVFSLDPPVGPTRPDDVEARPSRCVDAVRAVLERAGTDHWWTVSTVKTAIRTTMADEQGKPLGFRDTTIRDSLEWLASDGLLEHQTGVRGSRLFRWPQEQAQGELDAGRDEAPTEAGAVDAGPVYPDPNQEF